MERPTVLIISDEQEFVRIISSRWQAERNFPRLAVNDAKEDGVALIIVGSGQVPEFLRKAGTPLIQVARESMDHRSGVIHISRTADWPELVIAIAKEILERQKLACELSRLSKLKQQLECDASLGRYILEMRHGLNNALTSILGNSELMLMDTQSTPPSARFQLETIRNMAMRMNEILQRFTSLQKEMRLVEQQSAKKMMARGTSAGA